MNKMTKRLLLAAFTLSLLLGSAGTKSAAQAQTGNADQTPAAQDNQALDRGGNRGGNRGGRNFDPARMQEMMLQRMQENLGISNEDWAVIKPKVQAVMQAQMKTRAGGMMGMMGGRMGGRRGDGPEGPGGPGGPEGNRQQQGQDPDQAPPPPAPGQTPGQGPGPNAGPGGPEGNRPPWMQQSPEQTALRAAVESDKTSNEELKAKMAAYREAQKKNEDELKTSRENLRKVLTLQQEAKLVLSGTLD